MFIGFGTVVNTVAVVLGALIGLLLGHRLPQRTRNTVTDGLGLVTLLIGGLSAIEVTSPVLAARVGSSAPVVIVLAAIVLGGIIGSLLDLETRFESLGDWVRRKLSRSSGPTTDENPHLVDAPSTDQDSHAPVIADHSGRTLTARERFIEGFVTAALVYCIGPLTFLGTLSDGLGRGADQLILKSVLDFFAAVAFAASLGVGVVASALILAVLQGTLTLVAFLFGGLLPEPHLVSITATGGLVLVGLGIRLLNIKQVPVGNFLPALVVAPLLVQLVAQFN